MGKEKRITDDVKATVNLWIDQIQDLATVATGQNMDLLTVGRTYGRIDATLENAQTLVAVLDKQGQETAGLSRRLDQTKEMLQTFSMQGFLAVDKNGDYIDVTEKSKA